jgi:hypothetical protein
LSLSSHSIVYTFFPLLPSNTCFLCFLSPGSHISLPTFSVIHFSHSPLYIDSFIFFLLSCLFLSLSLSLTSTFIHLSFALNLFTSSLAYPFLWWYFSLSFFAFSVFSFFRCSLSFLSSIFNCYCSPIFFSILSLLFHISFIHPISLPSSLRALFPSSLSFRYIHSTRARLSLSLFITHSAPSFLSFHPIPVLSLLVPTSKSRHHFSLSCTLSPQVYIDSFLLVLAFVPFTQLSFALDLFTSSLAYAFLWWYFSLSPSSHSPCSLSFLSCIPLVSCTLFSLFCLLLLHSLLTISLMWALSSLKKPLDFHLTVTNLSTSNYGYFLE